MYTVVSTFAGGGGSSLGYKWAGYKELLAIDFDKNAVETLKANFEFPVWQKDIEKVEGKDILDFCKINSGDLDILDGSPPCQGFSLAGKRNINDNRNTLFLSFVRLINDLQPKVFIMENVSGMIKGAFKGFFNEIFQALKSTGYIVKCKKMNAMWYEVPQSRERLFFIGARKDVCIEPCFPEPMKTYITVKEAWKKVENKTFMPKLAKTATEIYENIKQGQNGSEYRKNYYFNTVKLHLNKPCCTINKNTTGTGTILHPTEKRTITIEECKRLCSFPDEYILIGSNKEQWARLGNAVMPKMMYHIAKNIKDNILDKYYGVTNA